MGKSRLKKFLFNLYAYSFLDDFVLIYAVYTIMFVHRGLNTFQIGLLLAIWSGLHVIFEVPSGALADKYNRKALLFLGQIFKAIGFAFWLLFPTFQGLALGFIFWGIQGVLRHGTIEALMYDELASFQKTSDYEKILGRTKFFRLTAVAISMSLGGLTASFYGYEAALIISIATMLISSIFPLLFPSAPIRKSTEEARYLTILKNALSEARRSPNLLRVIIFTSIFTAMWGTADEFYQLYYQLVNLPLKYFGLIGAAGAIISALGGLAAFKAKAYLKDLAIDFFFFFSGISLILLSLFRNLWMLIFLLFILFIVEIVATLLEAKIQHEISSDERATITCINAMLSNGEAILASIFFGFIGKNFGNQYGFFAFGLIVVLSSLLYLITKQEPQI